MNLNYKGIKSFEKNLLFLIFIFAVIFEITNLFANEYSEVSKEYKRDNGGSSTLRWNKIEENKIKKIEWNKITDKEYKFLKSKKELPTSINFDSQTSLNSLNRSIVFNHDKVGPDIGWLVPPGFSWNKKYKFDSSVRGHNRRLSGQKFYAWNGGDAVGQFYYQFLNLKKSSFGINLGARSVYSGSAAPGGGSKIGEGLSLGFRYDYQKKPTEGIAFGAEQLIHFDGLTDTGRDIYLTASKGIWKKNIDGRFPLDIFTFGIATGKMAEGNIKGFCSELFGGAGIEVAHQRPLCWSPVFSISRISNESLSTFFEYNSKFFIVGSSVVLFEEIPVRGTFGVIISDHNDNYKLKSFDELKWVFRFNIGL